MRRIAVFLLISIGLICCKPPHIIQESIVLDKLVDGVYQGSHKNINHATVEVVVQDGRIAELRLVELDATPFGQKAKDSIPARIVRTQTPYVDAVSGATEASVCIINATVEALSGSPIDSTE